MESEFLDDLNFRYQVGSIDEFISRFNERGVESSDMSLRLLFDGQSISVASEKHIEDAKHLIEAVKATDSKLDFADKRWFAKLECVGSLNAKSVGFTLYLTVEQRGKDWYSWVISHAEGSMFDSSADERKSEMFIPATDHEMNFRSLVHVAQNQPADIVRFLSESIPLTNAAVFCTLVKYGVLKSIEVKDISFEFYQIPGYFFYVKDFPRVESNGGWLIYDWGRMSEADKETLFRIIYPDGPSSPKSGQPQKDRFAPIPLSPDSAAAIVETFVGRIDYFLKTRDNKVLEEIESQIEGPYLFTAKGCKILTVGNPSKKEYSTDWERLLEGLLKVGSPAKELTISEIEAHENQTGKFTTLSGRLSVNGRPEWTERVVFYLHGNQVAGIRPE